MKRSFWILLLQALLFSVPLYAFDHNVNQSEFCINNAPNTLIFTVTHLADEEYHAINGIENIGVLTDVINATETQTVLVVGIDKSILSIAKHDVMIQFKNTSSSVVSTENQIIDVFGIINRTINFDIDTDLVYHCDYASINFTTEGDTLTDELVLVYIDNRFYKEQKVDISGTIGTLSDLRIERPDLDSLEIVLYLESSRDNQCLNRQQIQEVGLRYIAPKVKAQLDADYSVSSTVYGKTTFKSNAINSSEQVWEVYENGEMINAYVLQNNEDFTYTFSTSNFTNEGHEAFKKYDVILMALDASSEVNCDSGINRDTLSNIEIPYFPRVKVPTAVSKRSSVLEDGSYRLLIRNQINITSFNIQIFGASNQLVFESDDYNFVFGDDEELSSHIYNAKISLQFDDGLNEKINSSFIVTP